MRRPSTPRWRSNPRTVQPSGTVRGSPFTSSARSRWDTTRPRVAAQASEPGRGPPGGLTAGDQRPPGTPLGLAELQRSSGPLSLRLLRPRAGASDTLPRRVLRVDDRPTAATIELGAIRANYAELARRAAGRELIAVVKADGYGHGAVPVAQALAASGCRRFAVATVAEGVALRAAGVRAELLVLGGVHDAAEAAIEARLTPVVHQQGD